MNLYSDILDGHSEFRKQDELFGKQDELFELLVRKALPNTNWVFTIERQYRSCFIEVLLADTLNQGAPLVDPIQLTLGEGKVELTTSGGYTSEVAKEVHKAVRDILFQARD